MAQISRPFQIALVAIVLLAGVWLFALRGHSQSPSEATQPTPSTPPPSAQASSPGTPSKVYKGSAPGVAGLTKAIAKAHGAVATSEHNASQLEQRSRAASGEVSSTSAHTTATPAAKTARPAAPATSKTAPHGGTATKSVPQVTGSIKSRAGAGRTPARQALVERALAEGKPAVILFWNPSGSDDKAVRAELALLEAVHHIIRPVANEPAVSRALKAADMQLGVRFATFVAKPAEVSSFGTITSGVQVYSTPTLVLVGPSREAKVITGLTDAYGIQQALEEARGTRGA